MTSARAPHDNTSAGFTLIEAVVALALMGVILAALSTITAQWLPNWNRGIARAQAHERLGLALERVSSDFAAAEFIAIGGETRGAFFDGTDRSVILVRTAIGPNAEPGLEVVRIAETITDGVAILVRARAPFAPGIAAMAYPNEAKFTDPVVLLRASHRVAFSYAGADRVWRDEWRQQLQPPKAIRLTLRDVATRKTLSISTATLVHVELPIDCIAATSLAACQPGQPGPADAAQDAKPRS
jgi:general secretion pathway protein J